MIKNMISNDPAKRPDIVNIIVCVKKRWERLLLLGMDSRFGQKNQFKTNYEKIEILGNGSSGIVFKVRDKRDGNECAIKMLCASKYNKAMSQIKFEVLLQKDTLDHSNIVKYDDCWMEDLDSLPEVIINNLKLVFEYSDDSILDAICICMKMKLYSRKCYRSFTDITLVY